MANKELDLYIEIQNKYNNRFNIKKYLNLTNFFIIYKFLDFFVLKV